MDGKFCAWVHGAQCSQGAAVSPRRIKLMSQELFVSSLQGGFLLRTSAPGPSKTRISFSNHPYVAPLPRHLKRRYYSLTHVLPSRKEIPKSD